MPLQFIDKVQALRIENMMSKIKAITKMCYFRKLPEFLRISWLYRFGNNNFMDKKPADIVNRLYKCIEMDTGQDIIQN